MLLRSKLAGGLAATALLFASAGTLDWPAAWVFLVVSAIIGPACGLWLAKTDPALLAERLRPTFQADQPAADKKFMLTFVVATLVWLVAIGLDRRAQASDVPLVLQALGLAMYLLSTAFIMWVFRENSFAAPVVKVQAERHHRKGGEPPPEEKELSPSQILPSVREAGAGVIAHA